MSHVRRGDRMAVNIQAGLFYTFQSVGEELLCQRKVGVNKSLKQQRNWNLPRKVYRISPRWYKMFLSCFRNFFTTIIIIAEFASS